MLLLLTVEMPTVMNTRRATEEAKLSLAILRYFSKVRTGQNKGCCQNMGRRIQSVCLVWLSSYELPVQI